MEGTCQWWEYPGFGSALGLSNLEPFSHQVRLKTHMRRCVVTPFVQLDRFKFILLLLLKCIMIRSVEEELLDTRCRDVDKSNREGTQDCRIDSERRNNGWALQRGHGAEGTLR